MRKQFDRVVKYMADGKIIHGGRSDKNNLFIEPTLLTEADPQAQWCRKKFSALYYPSSALIKWMRHWTSLPKNKNPCLFIFSLHQKKEEKWLQAVSFGGGCVNNASWHLTNHNLPFGGIGNSGSGQYHGKFSFETFSHKKSVMKTPTWFDPAVKYPPFKGNWNCLSELIDSFLVD